MNRENILARIYTYADHSDLRQKAVSIIEIGLRCSLAESNLTRDKIKVIEFLGILSIEKLNINSN